MTIDKILEKMTLKDKIALCSGANFWKTKAMAAYGIPSIFMCDGPHGLRKQENKGDMLGIHESQPATCFPTSVTVGMSWDSALSERIGRAIGAEAAACGVDLVLGPGANIKRDPRCGRNFEYISEDPYVSGKMAAGFIRGLQENKTSASLKHFACNQQEYSRFTSDSVLDERTLREIYLSGFEIAVREGRPHTVMCAYPKINGVHCSDDPRLLTGILRNEWGFDGLVVTDWGAMNDRIEGFRSGCDLNMPGGSAYMEAEVLEAVRSGKLPESAVDASARRVLELVFRTAGRKAESSGGETHPSTGEENPQSFDGKRHPSFDREKRPSFDGERRPSFDQNRHHLLAREAAEQGAVLLKNEDSILPLEKSQKIALIGFMAKHPRYQGTGSSHINPYRVTSAVEAMPECVWAPGCDALGNTDDTLLAEAIAAAQNAEAAVVFAGLPDRYESEGFDRENLSMPEGHIRMIEAVAEANPNTVVVLLCGCVVECPWADRVKAILYMGLPGQAGGEAAARLLYGEANPCGKLTESWPFTYSDCPSSGCYGTKDAQYREGIYVGYRYYDKAGVKVRWPFGYGLSYTSFDYVDMRLDGNRVTVTVANTGRLAGAEVVQLYIQPPAAEVVRLNAPPPIAEVVRLNTQPPAAEVAQLYVQPPAAGLHRPVKELKGFQKVFLQPGEEKTVEFLLDDRSFAVWQDGWKIPGGNYTIWAGSSSQDLFGCVHIQKDGGTIPAPAWQEGSWYAHPSGTPDRETWEMMLGRPYVEAVPIRGQFTMDNSVMEMKEHSLIMKIMYKVTEMIIARGFDGKKDYSNPQFRMMMEASVGGPLRGMQISGGIKGGVFCGLLHMANGHFFKGLWAMLSKK